MERQTTQQTEIEKRTCHLFSTDNSNTMSCRAYYCSCFHSPADHQNCSRYLGYQMFSEVMRKVRQEFPIKTMEELAAA